MFYTLLDIGDFDTQLQKRRSAEESSHSKGISFSPDSNALFSRQASFKKKE